MCVYVCVLLCDRVYPSPWTFLSANNLLLGALSRKNSIVDDDDENNANDNDNDDLYSNPFRFVILCVCACDSTYADYCFLCKQEYEMMIYWINRIGLSIVVYLWRNLSSHNV